MPPMKVDPNLRLPYQYPMPKETLPDLVGHCHEIGSASRFDG